MRLESHKAAACNTVANNQCAIGLLQELDRALYDHMHWQNGVYRALVSDGALHEDAGAPDSETRCAFGRWYLGLPAATRARDRVLEDMWAMHGRMHASARDLLATHARHATIPAAAFDAYVNVAQDFKLALLKYQRRIISEVCTLDPLTGAGNRYAMDLRLTEEWERTRRTGLPCSLCMLDIDHFKRINDAHGHAAGDTALRVISRYLKGDGRAYDNLFRYGGEEFLICMPNTALAQAQAVFNRLREGLAALRIPLDDGGELSLTASFGVAPLLPDESIEHSVELADHALLCAKSSGRNRVCVWDMAQRD